MIWTTTVNYLKYQVIGKGKYRYINTVYINKVDILNPCTEATMQLHPGLYVKAALWHRLHFSIFTATVIIESSLASPYAVASTTFPNAPDPSVFPEDMTDTKL